MPTNHNKTATNHSHTPTYTPPHKHTLTKKNQSERHKNGKKSQHKEKLHKSINDITKINVFLQTFPAIFVSCSKKKKK